ncbi:unnamed protein product [Malus baccata var. baccata]
MGHKRKLQRTENCVMLRACTESSTLDRFSNLPIEVAHHILSFLSFKDLTRASAVSKRCKQLYLSNPTVSFDAISIPSSVMESLHDICNLGLHLRSLNDDIVPAVVYLFRAVTNMNTLHIKCSIFAGGEFSTDLLVSLLSYRQSSTFDTYYWKMQNLGFINELKEVTIEPFYGYNENEFAKYILEHAENLKKMVISYLKEKQSDVVAGMVSKSNMISSTAKVVIREIVSTTNFMREIVVQQIKYIKLTCEESITT